MGTTTATLLFVRPDRHIPSVTLNRFPFAILSMPNLGFEHNTNNLVWEGIVVPRRKVFRAASFREKHSGCR